MRILRLRSPFISLAVAAFMLFLTGPFSLAQAKMISTGSVIAASQAESARANINAFMSRADVKQELERMGISPDEAMQRAQNLSDSEAVAFADRLENAPAGGDGLGLLVGAALLVFLVLLATDILGYTKVFSFTRSAR